MLTLSENVKAQFDSARHKTHGFSRPANYLVAAMLAGLFIGLADIFMLTAGGPLKMAASPWAPLISGGVFGIGLILVVFAGGELATSAMMILPMSLVRKQVKISAALGAFITMIVGNLLGSILVSFLVWGTGIMTPETASGQALAAYVSAKAHHSGGELFFRGIMCNILVCLGMWCVTRTKSDVSKIILMAWCMAAFVGSGFEHVVANMTTFALGIMHGVPDASFYEAARNLSIVLGGNIVGGCLIGGAYLLASRTEDHHDHEQVREAVDPTKSFA